LAVSAAKLFDNEACDDLNDQAANTTTDKVARQRCDIEAASRCRCISSARAKDASKHPEKFGTGCVDGIFASEVSNNATVGGVVIPMTALGIPGDATTALLLGALTIQGIQPGPLLFEQNPLFVYIMFGGMLVATIMVLLVQFFGMRLFPMLLKTPLHYLYPGIILMCLVGAFADTNTVFNIGLMIFFAIMGIILSIGGFPMSTLILAYILTPIIELNLRRGIEYSSNGLWPFITRPVSAFLLLVALYSILRPFLHKKKH
jgi:putative tricarboxylic transport membrane protein